MEIILYITLAISLILNIFLFYRGYRLISQIEETQKTYLDFEDDVIQTLETMLTEMKEIDIRGSFESDDEVGVVFRELKDIIEKYKNNF
jgi:HKD family nuclease